MRCLLLALQFLLVASASAPAQEPPVVPVTVTAKGCEPNELTIKAGRVTFLIANKSSRAMEWEILKGVMIVDERENIAPGFKQKLTTTLEPGDYEIACGLLSNPRGRLVVLNAEGGRTAGPAKPGAADLVGLGAEHRVWLIGEAKALTKAAEAGDRAAARSAFVRLSTLEGVAASQAAAAAAALAQPQGDIVAPAAAYAEALRQTQISPLALTRALAAAAHGLTVAPAADAPTLFAALETQLALLTPLARRADPALAAEFDAALARTRAALSGGATGEAADALAAQIGKLPAALGLS
ncbi:MAG: cupredoxin domain-containing protein [Rhizobiales bacterium]|nr:cupredoxin domain-containing protein [Hyphomicrobiales bacterium]